MSFRQRVLRPVVGIYYCNWSIYADDNCTPNKFPCLVPFDNITHIYYAFFTIDQKTGQVKSNDENADFRVKRDFVFRGKLFRVKGLNNEFVACINAMPHGNRPKLIMSVGGYEDSENFTHIIKDGRKTFNFVKSCINFMKRYHFDGIDIDWEYPDDKSQGTKFAQLLSLLYKDCSITVPRLVISVASPACEDQLQNYKLSIMERYVDYFNVMAYDFTGPWSDKVGHLANIFSTSTSDSSCDKLISLYLKEGVPAGKLILGIPLYGRLFFNTEGFDQTFETCTNEEYKEGTISLTQLLDFEIEADYDDTSGACFYYDSKRRIFITFDDSMMIEFKADFIKSRQLAGGFFWESSCDFSYKSDHSHVSLFAKIMKEKFA